MAEELVAVGQLSLSRCQHLRDRPNGQDILLLIMTVRFMGRIYSNN
jgi:hypothetical protein